MFTDPGAVLICVKVFSIVNYSPHGNLQSANLADPCKFNEL